MITSLTMEQVSIRRIKDMDVSSTLKDCLEDIGGITQSIQPGMRVLIKPNLNDDLSFSDPRIVSGLVTLAREAGAKDVFIGESTFGNAAITARHFKATGYDRLAEELDVRLVNFNESEGIAIKVPSPLSLDEVIVAREAAEADIIINVPVMKVHYATGITLALKNLKGLLPRDGKRKFHEIGLDNAIIDLNRALPGGLHIIDCITCMETMGPKGGDLLHLGLIIAGTDAAAVDLTGAAIMGFKPEEVGHLSGYLKATGRAAVLPAITGEKLADCIRPFKRASAVRMVPDNFSIHDAAACSACMNALLISFRFFKTTPAGSFSIFTGPGAIPESEFEATRVAFGSCCAVKDAAVRIKGCPPYPPDLFRILEENSRNS